MTLDKARAWGIEAGFHDYKGEWHETSPATERALLDAMGAEDDTPRDAAVLVVRRGQTLERQGSFEVRLEDGSERALEGGGPIDLPLGYHALVDGTREVPLIVGPGRCYLPDDLHVWGWGTQVYALHSESSWGHGDLGDLVRLGRWSRMLGAGMLLLNPLHAAAPQEASPYFPSSRCFRNPLYIDVEAVAAEMNIPLDEHVIVGRALNSIETIERQAVYETKISALGRLWSQWQGSGSFERYRAEAGAALTDFATYVSIAEEHGWEQGEWPEDLKHPDSPAVARRRAERGERIRFHEWLQWLLREQLDRAGEEIDLVHDLAIGVAPGGADAWLWNEVFAHDVRIGAPPDEIALGGQDWAMPPFDPWKLTRSAYEPFVQTVRAALSGGAGMRVDHVMGLFRLWWIPEGAPATEGAYVRYPKDDLLNILALESHRARSYVIGEDLGTVEPSVREEMAERNMLSYRLMWFEPSPPVHFPALALAAVTNHDLPTIAGLWTGADLHERKDIGIEVDEDAELFLRSRLRERTGVDDDAAVEEVIERAYAALAEAPCRIKVATLEDALAVEQRPNHPGTIDERPNWSLRLPLSLDELEAAPLPRRIAEALTF